MARSTQATSIGEKTLRMALSLLKEWEEQPVSIDDLFDSKRKQAANQQVVRICANLVLNYFRHKQAIDTAIATLTKKVKPKFRRLLAVVLTQCRFQTGISPQSAINIAVDHAKRKFGKKQAGFINAVLRNSQQLDFAELQQGQVLPEALRHHWTNQLGEEQTTRLGQLLTHEYPISFRLIDTSLAAELNDDVYSEIQLPEWTGKHRFFHCNDPECLFKTDWLTHGRIYIQDPSTVAFASLLADVPAPETMVDLCAAPGGKSLVLRSLFADAMLVAADRSPIRQKRTAANLAKPCHDIVSGKTHVVVSDALSPGLRPHSFGLVLVDAPCSNTGVFKHRPDIIWRFSQQRLEGLVAFQQAILDRAQTLVAPDGFLLYSTCSIDQAENQQQVSRFLQKNAAFKLVKECPVLPETNFDGCYSALLART